MLNLFRLESLGRIRLAAGDPEVIEIECEMSAVATAGGLTESFWLPINEVATLPLGAMVTDRDFHVTPQPRTRHRVKCFRTDDVRDLFFSYASRVETPNGSMMLPESPAKRACYVHMDGPVPVAVPAMELTRFYLAGMSVAVDHLMQFDVEPDAVFDRYCDLSRTGYLDEARREFRVAPKAGLCDRGAALQIAILMTDQRLRSAFAAFVRGVRRSAAAGGDAELPVFRSSAPLDLKFDLADQDDGRFIKLKGHLLADRVVSDYRKPAFDRLVIELPVGYDQAAFNDPGPPPKNDPRPPVDPNAELTRERRPGSRSFKTLAAQGGFAQTFPFLNGVKTRYEVKTRLPPPAPRPVGTPPPPPIREYSPLPRGGKAPVARLNVVPRSDPEDTRERPSHDDRSFSDDVDDALLPRLVAVDGRGLDERMARFANAGSALAGDGLLDIAASSLAGAGGGSLRVFELSRACGRWAWSRKRGRGRHVLFLPVLVGDRAVWAVSIERKSEWHLSMGLLLARGPVAELDFVARTLGALAKRNSRLGKGDPRSFPEADYADVRFASLIHSPPRVQVSVLAKDIYDRAVGLVKRDGGYDADAV